MRNQRGFWIFSGGVWVIAVTVTFLTEDWLSAVAVALVVPFLATLLRLLAFPRSGSGRDRGEAFHLDEKD